MQALKEVSVVRSNGYSQAAARSMRGKPKEQQRQRILEAIRIYGPLNTDEIEVKTGIKHQSASPLVLELRKAGVLDQKGERPTRSDRMAAVWGLAGQVGLSPLTVGATVSVDPAGPEGTVEGLFTAVPEPAKPALRASNYSCGHVTTSKGTSTPCNEVFTEIRQILFDSRFVEGWCPKHKWTAGSLIRVGEYPTGWGKDGMPAVKVKPNPYGKRRRG